MENLFIIIAVIIGALSAVAIVATLEKKEYVASNTIIAIIVTVIIASIVTIAVNYQSARAEMKEDVKSLISEAISNENSSESRFDIWHNDTTPVFIYTTTQSNGNSWDTAIYALDNGNIVLKSVENAKTFGSASREYTFDNIPTSIWNSIYSSLYR